MKGWLSFFFLFVPTELFSYQFKRLYFLDK